MSHPGSTIPRSVLLRRFSEFSTAGSFILLCLADKSTGERSHIVLENDEWYIYSRSMGIHFFSSSEEYTRYMVEHANDCVPVPVEAFRELNRLFGAPQKEEFIHASRKGIPSLRQEYLERVPWVSGYEIREWKYAHDRSFLRVLLELGLVVRRECESGRRYVEAAEVDASIS
jgi:hypothetical protein